MSTQRCVVMFLIQALFCIVLSVVVMLQSECLINIKVESQILILMKIVYFWNPEQCGYKLIIGEFWEELPDQAFIYMDQVPATYDRAYYYNVLYIFTGAVWLGALKLIYHGRTRIFWIFLSVFMCVLDLSAMLTFINDSYHTKTFRELLTYIGAEAHGFGNVEPDTSFVAKAMTLLITKCGIFVIINFCLVVILSAVLEDDVDELDRWEAPEYWQVIGPLPRPRLQPRRDFGPQDFVLQNLNETRIENEERTEVVQTVPHTTPEESVPMSITAGVHSKTLQRAASAIELHNMYAIREIRNELLRMAPSALIDVDLVESPPRTYLVGTDVRRLRRALSTSAIGVRVPDSLLSLPQRLEKLIKDESRKIKAVLYDTLYESVRYTVPVRVNTGTTQNGEIQRGNLQDGQWHSLNEIAYVRQLEERASSLPNFNEGSYSATTGEVSTIYKNRDVEGALYNGVHLARRPPQSRPGDRRIGLRRDKLTSMQSEPAVHTMANNNEQIDDARRVMFYRSLRDVQDVLY